MTTELPKRVRQWISMLGGGETHPLFLALSFLGAFGAALGRKVWLERSRIYLPPLYPNPWVLLLGPSGRAKKSTAIRLAVRLIEEAEVAPEVFSGKLTPEALISVLAAAKRTLGPGPSVEVSTGRAAEALIVSREFDVLISSKQQYTTGLVPLLTDLYDCPERFVVTTIGRGREVLENVCLSVIGAGVPLTLQAQLPPEAVKGGFLPRFLLGILPQGWRRRVAHPPAVRPEDWGEMVEWVGRTAGFSGALELSREAADRYVEWYERELDFADSEIEDAYLQRVPEHVLRLAVLFHFLDEVEEHRVGVEHFEMARIFMDKLWKRIRPALRVFASNPRMRGYYYALGVLEERKLLKKSDLLALLAPFASSMVELEKTAQWLCQHPQVQTELQGKEMLFKWRDEDAEERA